MKHILLLPFIIAAVSCSKETTEKPVRSRSVTYQRWHYVNGVVVLVDTSIHWHNVTGADLERFEKMDQTRYYICDSYPEIWGQLVIGPACQPGTNHKP